MATLHTIRERQREIEIILKKELEHIRGRYRLVSFLLHLVQDENKNNNNFICFRG